MFKSLGNMASMMKQAREMGGRIEEMNLRLREECIQGSSGGGMVTVEMNGLGDVLKISIEPELVQKGERELIEDLVRAAVNETREKTKTFHAQLTQQMAAELEIPGLEEALSIEEQPNDDTPLA
ncbi:MAG: YbaB/EbfC family nucleoid-associated protein [Planctomycetota bacterium]|nr:YbaB/EbfC family nucleoid-associated protein [Planctomycetota bacterium]